MKTVNGTIIENYESRGINFVFNYKKQYSLRPIILFANMNISKYILVVDISVLAKSNMSRREY
jgi:hypothetical protein